MGPLRGVADTHTHPLSNLGFGGMIWGDPTVWGDPNSEDLSSLVPCDAGNHGGRFRLLGTDVFLPVVGLTDFSRRALLGIERQGLAQHGPDGSPTFLHWPDFADGLHSQYHIRFIYRAYKCGKLRLMSALAVSNRLLSRFMKDPQDQSDADAVQAQIAAITTMVGSHSSWMEIAFTPNDVRRIIGEDRLAVVLGTEVDQLDTLCDDKHNPDNPPDTWVPWLVDTLYRLGIRQVTPLHFADNRFGGFAVYDDLTNSGNQYATGHFAKVELDPDIDFKLSQTQMRFTEGIAALPEQHNEYDRSNPNMGHRNVRPLMPAGVMLVNELIKRGMIIDIDHMGQNTVINALAVVLPKQYPVLSSHNFIRHVAFRDSEEFAYAPNPCTGGAPLRLGPVPSERGLTDEVVTAIASLGGMLSPGTAGGASVKLQPTPESRPFPFKQTDVPAGSSIAWAVSYMEAVRMLRDAGQTAPRVGLGTDFSLTPGMGPRFGPRIGARPGLNVTQPRSPAGAPLLYRGQEGAALDAILPYVVGQKSYDFNTEGMAHYGMLADFLADLRVIGLKDSELAPLYSSAEAYTQMWETCRAISGIKPEDP